MNKVILSGNLCQDVELKTTQGGKSVVTNRIAVQREYKNASGSYDSDFIDLEIWGAQAEYLSRYGKKGDRVELVGRWKTQKYQDKNDNKTRTAHECVVESIRVFNRQPKEEQSTEPSFEDLAIDTDLPF